MAIRLRSFLRNGTLCANLVDSDNIELRETVEPFTRRQNFSFVPIESICRRQITSNSKH